jgi:DMSO/TMAO reductase YedYZ molybdopterin-dependent catalytic subunit
MLDAEGRGRMLAQRAIGDDRNLAPLPSGLRVITQDPLCAEVPLSSLNSWITPNERYFIRSHFPVPRLDLSAWRLVVEGDVDRPSSWTFPELRTLAEQKVVSTMECAGNSRNSVQPPAEGVKWTNGALGTARWSGVSLGEVLTRAGVRATAKEVVFEGADHGNETGASEEINYAMSVPLEKALEPDTLLAYQMNGEPLSTDHGYPVRVIVPDWYGMASVKWVTRVQVIGHSFQGFFRTRPYVFIHEGDDPSAPKTPVTRLLVKSLITWPKEGSTLPPGRHTLRGVAWSGEGQVTRVEVCHGPVDDDRHATEWEPATILEPRAAHAWVCWEHSMDFTRPGYYVVRARATDERGNVQPLRADWNFRGVGTNSVHAIPVIVR